MRRNGRAFGKRTAIELALKAQKTVALQNPSLRCAKWSNAFPDLDLIIEAGATCYAPTGLSLRNFAEQEVWLDFELTQSEMTALVDAAHAEMRGLLVLTAIDPFATAAMLHISDSNTTPLPISISTR